MPLPPPSSLASLKSRLVRAFRRRLIQVVLEKRPLNGCLSVCLLLLLLADITKHPVSDNLWIVIYQWLCTIIFTQELCLTHWSWPTTHWKPPLQCWMCNQMSITDWTFCPQQDVQQQQQLQQPFYIPLSGTTRVSRYQKKHSPTHHPDHHPIFISFFHLPLSISSSLLKLCAWQSFCTTSFHVLTAMYTCACLRLTALTAQSTSSSSSSSKVTYS